ncbi:MAG TPA: DNA mismatch repair protein MutS [Bacteroidia bacterium]|nr:DNA mismatch repair protein MutS [Bacteroidia bacterium]
MRQHSQIKAKYPGAVVLFRVGDFYETFGEDAVVASKVLGIVLTKRNNGYANEMALAGFPHHSLDTYLPKMVRAGYRVAICDQLEDPKLTKGLVKRGVTELVTPGVSYNDKIVDVKQSNYLASVFCEKDSYGVAFLDISTGEFMVAQGSADYTDKLLQGLKPSEIIFSKSFKNQFFQLFGEKFYTYAMDEWAFGKDHTRDKLLKHFGTASLKGFGIDDFELGIVAAGAAVQYLEDTHHNELGHISAISRLEEDKYVWLDKFTIRNLELVRPSAENGKALIDVLDNTLTPMGARLLRKWLLLPLKEISPINNRLNMVSHFTELENERQQAIKLLSQVGDLERLISKAALKRIGPKEMVQLRRSLELVGPVKELCSKSGLMELQRLADLLNPCHLLVEKIKKEVIEEPPSLINKGGVVADGVDSDLDELREIKFTGKDYLVNIQKREAERTGIPSLKIAFNNVFGYYLEVSNTHKSKVPPEWIRKQTLVNAERYITEELKVYEEKILGAEEKILTIETRIFNDLLNFCAEYIGPVQQNAHVLAQLDCIVNFAELAANNNYVRPEITEGYELDLKDVRHPVIEKQLPIGEAYIPNDIYLDNGEQQVIILTGPNMSGKSAILRQTALAVLLAQMGCFVPAKSATIGLIDKIFTRVGASDNISSGESTFMVEMLETASILNNVSNRSLILLDEIGRGTSTYDGVSLAWAIAEYLNQQPQKPKTIFATHYHELNELEKKSEGVVNYHVTVKEVDQQVIFLRKLKRGGSESSFGIHVAKMAGIPNKVVQRADEILSRLEQDRAMISGRETLKKFKPVTYQVNMFQAENPHLIKLEDELNKIDLNALTPIEALMKLKELKEMGKAQTN